MFNIDILAIVRILITVILVFGAINKKKKGWQITFIALGTAGAILAGLSSIKTDRQLGRIEKNTEHPPQVTIVNNPPDIPGMVKTEVGRVIENLISDGVLVRRKIPPETGAKKRIPSKEAGAKAPVISVVNTAILKLEAAQLRRIDLTIQNLGESATSARINPAVFRNGIPHALDIGMPDRLDFGPHGSFTVQISIPEKEAEVFLGTQQHLVVQLDIIYSSINRDKLDQHYKYVGQYDSQTNSFLVRSSSLVNP